MCGQRKLATAIEGRKDASFRLDAESRLPIRDPCKNVSDPPVFLPIFQPQSSLPHGRQGKSGRKKLPDSVGIAQSDQSRRGENDGIDLSFFHLPEARSDISPERHELEVRAKVSQLRDASQRRGPDAGSWRKGFQGGMKDGNECVPWIFPGEDGSKNEPLRQKSGNILHAVNGQIDGAFKKGILDLFHEKSLSSDLGKWDRENHVSGSLYDLELARHFSAFLDQLSHMARLPEGQFGAPGADSNGRGIHFKFF